MRTIGASFLFVIGSAPSKLMIRFAFSLSRGLTRRWFARPISARINAPGDGTLAPVLKGDFHPLEAERAYHNHRRGAKQKGTPRFRGGSRERPKLASSGRSRSRFPQRRREPAPALVKTADLS